MATKSPAKSSAIKTVMFDEKKWQAQDDLRTLQRAREIEANRSRMAAAKREADAQLKALQKVKLK
jgi:hypothetical protein